MVWADIFKVYGKWRREIWLGTSRYRYVSTEISTSFFKNLLLWLTVDPVSYSETSLNVYQKHGVTFQNYLITREKSYLWMKGRNEYLKIGNVDMARDWAMIRPYAAGLEFWAGNSYVIWFTVPPKGPTLEMNLQNFHPHFFRQISVVRLHVFNTIKTVLMKKFLKE
jgi:hypothetical protein